MTPIEIANPSSAIAAQLQALGAECETRSCAECGRLLVGRAGCRCAARERRVGRLRRSLVDVDWAATHSGHYSVRAERLA